jgi:tripartite-type tricarboxylate transporter receptor subunit TctC
MIMKTKVIAILLAALAGAAVAQDGFAQDKYPAKPITFIVPQAPGGANDTVGRILAHRLSENMGVQFVVDNRPGAGGNIGTAVVAKAPKDGYTLLLTVNSAHVINPAIYKNPGFDPVKDFEPITPFATVAYLWVAHPGFEAKSIKDLIDMAKAKPGAITYASAGNGTLNHLLGEMLKSQTGIDLQHIPYKGAVAAATDVVAGRVPVSVQSMPSVISFIQSGKLKVLAVANEKRVNALPDVPAASETVKGYGSTPWYGVFAPAGTPRAIVTRLHGEIVKALGNADLVERMKAQGAEVSHSTPEQFAAQIRAELPQWAQVVKSSGAQID